MKRKKGFLALSIIIASLIMAAGYINLYVKRWDNKIYPNSFIGSLNISGMAAEEARSALEAYSTKQGEKKISAVYGDKTYTASLKELKEKEDVDKIVSTAMAYGKGFGFFKRFGVLRVSSPRLYNLRVNYNEKSVRNFIENIKKDINIPAQNAYISEMINEKPIVVKEVYGREVAEKELFEDIIANSEYSTDDIRVEVKVAEVKPKIVREMLQPIDTLVSSFATNYSVSSVGRSANIALAALKINGTIVLPGEEFSFNNLTGERTLKNGFKGAPVIINDKLVDGVAGGVCQVSTTLHNAVVRLGIKPTVRRNHTLVPAYVQPGFDATVSEFIDYRFKNTLKYPLYIQGKAQGGRLTFNIYSNSTLIETKYVLVNEIVETIEPQSIYNPVNTIPAGSVEKIQEPIKGYKVKVYMVGYKNGKEISRELIYKDNYNKVDEIFNVGI